MRREGKVFVHNNNAGLIVQDDEGYIFTYDENYIKSGNPPVSLTMPLQSEPFKSNSMIPFFDGLIPEGFLLDIAEINWKINRRDRMGLLLAVCKDVIGAVRIERM